MRDAARPFRSVLYIPASNARAIDKARSVPADAIIFDLEDSVHPDEKANARAQIEAALAEGGFGSRALVLRINGLDTPWGRGDAAMAGQAAVDAVLIPKVNGPGDIDAVAEAIAGRVFWVMIETPAGVLNAGAIAAHPRVTGLVMGTNDLVKDLGAQLRPGRQAISAALQMAVLAARASGCVAIDGVFPTLREEAGLRAECAQGREMGFDGKTLIHPEQIAAANEAFAPTADDLDLARRQIAAFEAARAKGQGVAVVDGKLVENLHIVTARQVLSKAEAIAELVR